ncbi:hypothetical protein GLOTRDRAFT_133880 [Gloeophyllum trabeum ATCC 11539]|uniref:3'-5' exonuclease n=1 Tax=Gloeophyllum trabeum (strain ATCC 11539 / FP-39264 / Madison 617) TaxID=670483 RepID=S7R857_GLOTA|nr:uncharacterized protein GLOTRDRAFT_133880 [Gloeophyllum trabeum ATCC 11539]EPQ50510.1 hypothetical protein GLOTRDRAFT_133880 [Gloeophyllum trabeum ATCC 11539]
MEPTDPVESAPPAPRKRGRPKGSKNGPNAKNVGRPRKDGQPPTRRLPAQATQGAGQSSQKQTEQRVPDHNAHLPSETRSTAPPAPPSEESAPDVVPIPATESASAARTPGASVEGTLAQAELPGLQPGGTPLDVHSSAQSGTRLDIPPDTANASAATSSSGVATDHTISDDVRALSLLPATTLSATGLHRDLQEIDAVGDDTGGDGQFALESRQSLPLRLDVSDSVQDIAEEASWGIESSPDSGAFSWEEWSEEVDGDLEDDEDLEHILGPTNDDGSIDEDEFIPVPDDDESDSVRFANTPRNGSHGRVPRSSIPTWLLEDYADVREKIQSEMRRNPTKRPTCYDRATFTEGSPFPFFAADRKHQPMPQDFYRPSYFVWLPHLLVSRIPCPACAAAGRRRYGGDIVFLRSHGFPRSPRRVVDIDQCIYLIGFRYQCGHEECKRTFTSWSPSIINALPRALACHFDFHLTYRGGLTDRVVALMRSSFQHGMGPTPFADMIRTHHLRRYEKLHEQYLEIVLARLQTPFTAYLSKFKPFGLFDDRSGYAGFTPSPNYFRQFYVQYINSHAKEMDKYTAMLSGKILVIDHSHQVPKHLGKVNGVPVFTALHTCTNEFNEVRTMVMTPSKAHNEYMPALREATRSLEMYGHEPVQLVFTDNVRSDKAALEAIIPSLREGVTPVADLSTLAPLSVPPDWEVILLSSVYQINTRFNDIMDDMGPNSKLYTAVDMEWSVDRSSGLSGRVAVISVAFNGIILLIWLRSCLRNGCLYLPSALLAFLRSPSVLKIGVKVTADLKRLFENCGFQATIDAPFRGAVNLGALAKIRNPSIKATTGLVELVAVLLRQHLPKDDTIRVSTDWDNDVMSEAQQQYAALDVYASWAVFKALETRDDGEPVTASTPGGTLVTLVASDHRPVAQGHIALDRPKKVDGVNVSPKRVVVIITSVLVPGHLIPKELLPGNEDKPLYDFPSPPFTLLCKERHLRTRAASETQPTHSVTTSATENISAALVEDHASEEINDNTSDDPYQPFQSLVHEDWDMCTEGMNTSEQVVETSASDPSAQTRADALASDELGVAWETLRGRVLGDIFHVMHEFKISVHHGLRRPFSRALRDAFFIPDPEDKAIMETFLEGRNTTWDKMLLFHSRWLFQRVKRIVPPAEILLPRVRNVLQKFGPLKDSITGQPLFNDRAWDTSGNVLENIRRGYYSDPPGVQLYFIRGRDKYGLMRYKCCRGTNAIEGGVHQNIIRWFGSFNAAPEFALQLLRDYVLYHNLKVGTLNRTGVPYVGSFDIWVKNRISALLDITSSRFESLPLNFGPGGWVNGDLYAPSTEVFGILALPDYKRLELGMLPYHHQFAIEQKIRHRQLAFRQNARIAILPVHTSNERALFKLLITGVHGCFGAQKEPQWDLLAVEWAKHANGTTIFYKLKEHLKSYWKTWGENVNEKKSIQINQAAYQEISARLEADKPNVPRRQAAHPVPLRKQVKDSSDSGGQGAHGIKDIADEWDVGRLLGAHSIRQSAIHFNYGEGDLPPPAPRPLDAPGSPTHPRNATKRVRADSASTAERQRMLVRKRKKRACVRCNQTNCKGRFKGRACAPDTDDDEDGRGQAGPSTSRL